jgi:hypothetical protein
MPVAHDRILDDYSAIKRYLERHYRHFNAAALVDAAVGYESHLERAARCWSPWRAP